MITTEQLLLVIALSLVALVILNVLHWLQNRTMCAHVIERDRRRDLAEREERNLDACRPPRPPLVVERHHTIHAPTPDLVASLVREARRAWKEEDDKTATK
jgi:hypothetical protein